MNPKAILVLDTELTTEELEEITGGALTLTKSFTTFQRPTLSSSLLDPRLSMSPSVADQCSDTGDSGTMGCPG